MPITLTKTETAVLTAAAEQADRLIVLPERMKPTSRTRLLARLARDGLAEEQEGQQRITDAGYRAIGLAPPRKPKAAPPERDGAAASADRAARSGSKLALVRTLLARPEGAALAELTAATGWLPHTTRAVLSRIRHAGQPLDKQARPDGMTAYRIAAAA